MPQHKAGNLGICMHVSVMQSPDVWHFLFNGTSGQEKIKQQTTSIPHYCTYIYCYRVHTLGGSRTLAGIPEQSHVCLLVNRVDKDMSHELWLGLIDPKEQCVTGPQADLEEGRLQGTVTMHSQYHLAVLAIK